MGVNGFSKLLYLLGLLVELLVLVNGYSHLKLAGVLTYLILGLLLMRNYVSFALLFIISAIIALYEYLTTLNFMFVVLFVLFVVAFITCFIKSGMKKYKKHEKHSKVKSKVKRYDKINAEKSAKINAEKFTEDFTATDSHKSHDSHKSEKIYKAETPAISTYGGDNAEEKFAEAVNILNKISDDSDKNALESKKRNIKTRSGKTAKKTSNKVSKKISKKTKSSKNKSNKKAKKSRRR